MKNLAPDIKDEITEGSLHRATLRLAIPACLSMVMASFFSINDFFWTGQVEKAAGDIMQSALAGMLYFIIMNIAVGNVFGIGATALVARYTGARDDRNVSFIIRQALVWVLLVVSIAGLLEFLFAEKIVRFIFLTLDEEPEVMRAGTIYTRMIMASFPVMLSVPVCAHIFRARGNTKTPFFIDLASIILNTALNPLFLLVFDWGIAGLALATAFSRGAAFVIYMYLIFTGRTGVTVKISQGIKPHLRTLVRIVKIGVPASVSSLLYAFIGIVVGWIVQQFGKEAYTGAIGIGIRGWESICFHIMMGISLSASALVGQNLGAGKPERAAKAGWIAVLYASIVGGFFMILFNAIPGTLAWIYNDNPLIISHAVDYLTIIGLSQVFQGAQVALSGAFAGAGNTMPPMLVAVTLNASRIPLGAFIALGTVKIGKLSMAGLGLGVQAIWWVMFSTTILAALVLAGWFMLGRWKRHEV